MQAARGNGFHLNIHLLLLEMSISKNESTSKQIAMIGYREDDIVSEEQSPHTNIWLYKKEVYPYSLKVNPLQSSDAVRK